jgi:hypothetical protein
MNAKPVIDEAIRKLIAARAYELWENQGRQHGHDQIIWRQAEYEIMSCIGDGAAPAAPETPLAGRPK